MKGNTVNARYKSVKYPILHHTQNEPNVYKTYNIDSICSENRIQKGA